MSHTYNIDIDSNLRDRKTYPDCGNFVIPLNTRQSLTVDAFNAKDPVILGFPYDTGIYTGVNHLLFFTKFFLQITLGASSSNQVDFYVGNVLQIPSVDYYGIIVAYDKTTKIVTCEPDFLGVPAPGPSTYYTIRPQFPQPIPVNSNPPNYVNTLPVVAPSTTKIDLGAAIGSTLTKEFIIGKYIYVQPPITIEPWFEILFPHETPTNKAQFMYQWSLIIDFDPATNIITVQKPFLIPLPAGTKYEILNFSYDNAQPLNYSGTDIFSNPRCCTINLVNCIVPNYLPLSCTNGGYLTDYPFVWIAFYTEGNRTYNQPLMSMSPVSDRALFKVPISPNSDVNTTKFLTLNSGVSSQTVYFKHNDSFRFEMYLPNGEPVKFNPAFFNIRTGIYTYFLGLGFPVPTDLKANIHAQFRVSFN